MMQSGALPVLPLKGRRHVILAVSGGSDSTALLHLAALQTVKLANPPALTCVTVDHQLRPGSQDEARNVASMCKALGVRHQTLVWDGAKPNSGIQDAARIARRRLIAASAAEIGADAVFTGHTFNDQMETVAMRQKRGPGPGLAGIAPVSIVFNHDGAGEPVPFIRPLLEATRTDLRVLLQTLGAAWIDDPSNENAAFERVAIRRELADASPEHLRDLVRTQQIAARERHILSDRVAHLIDDHVFTAAPGLIRLEHKFAEAPDPDGLAGLQVLMAFSAGLPRLADISHATRLLVSWRQRISGPGIDGFRIGLGGMLADIRKQGVYLMQEKRLSPASKSFPGRYRLPEKESSSRLPLPKMDPIAAPASLVRKAAAAVPVFDCSIAGEAPADKSDCKGRCLQPIVNPWPELVPSFDLPAYNALAKITGSPQVDLPML